MKRRNSYRKRLLNYVYSHADIELLYKTFSRFLIITILFSILHIIVDFNETKRNTVQSIDVAAKQSLRPMANTLWQEDISQFKINAESLLTEVPDIVGVKVINTEIGEVIFDKGETSASNVDFSDFTSFFLFERIHMISYGNVEGEARKMGELYVYSSLTVIMDNTKMGIFMILFNSIFKTLALWLIFLTFSKKILKSPFQELSSEIRKLSFNDVEELEFKFHSNRKNEFRTIELAFQILVAHINHAHSRMADYNINLQEEVSARTKKLEDSNLNLKTSYNRMEDLSAQRLALLKNVGNIDGSLIPQLERLFKDIQEVDNQKDLNNLIQQAQELFRKIHSILQPINSQYQVEEAVKSKRVLFADRDPKHQIIAKQALRGSGVELIIVDNVQNGIDTIVSEPTFDVVYSSSEFIDVANLAHESSQETKCVYMTAEKPLEYLPVLRKYPFLTSMIHQGIDDRVFELKNVLTTLSKLINPHNMFGIDKYLNWGVEVKTHKITSSVRSGFINEMEEYFDSLDIRGAQIRKAVASAEELLMNAIYDAPRDSNGKELYNHLPRTKKIQLKPEEHATFRYACDGILLAISVEDPFGGLERSTMIDYFESCYTNQAGSLNKKKGGAGRGLHYILENSDLFVINVNPKVKTEIIAVFQVQPTGRRGNASFHYFCL